MSESFEEKRIGNAKYIICSCEGAAEIDIIKLLLDNNLLLFNREQVVFDGITNDRKASVIQEKFLGVDYDEKVLILRIIDSKKDSFTLKSPYDQKCDVINVNTTPEIEMLLIIYFGKYKDFQKYKSKITPSQYCTTVLKLKGNKKQGYIYNLFKDNVDELVRIIKEYGRVTKCNKRLNLRDLLK